jgi:hypothetical protein
MMKKSTVGASAKAEAPLQVDTVKSAKYVTLKVKLRPDVQVNGLRLFATSERLSITGLPDHSKRTLRFPCPVYARSGKVTIRNDRITVRMKRKPPDVNEYELFIRP